MVSFIDFFLKRANFYFIEKATHVWKAVLVWYDRDAVQIIVFEQNNRHVHRSIPQVLIKRVWPSHLGWYFFYLSLYCVRPLEDTRTYTWLAHQFDRLFDLHLIFTCRDIFFWLTFFDLSLTNAMQPYRRVFLVVDASIFLMGVKWPLVMVVADRLRFLEMVFLGEFELRVWVFA